LISTKYRTLYYLNIIYCHTYYDVCTLPCVLGVTSLWREEFADCVGWTWPAYIIDKAIKQAVAHRPELVSRPKVAPFEHKL